MRGDGCFVSFLYLFVFRFLRIQGKDLANKLYLTTPVAWAAVRSDAVDSLFIVPPIACGGFVFGPCFVMLF